MASKQHGRHLVLILSAVASVVLVVGFVAANHSGGKPKSSSAVGQKHSASTGNNGPATTGDPTDGGVGNILNLPASGQAGDPAAESTDYAVGLDHSLARLEASPQVYIGDLLDHLYTWSCRAGFPTELKLAFVPGSSGYNWALKRFTPGKCEFNYKYQLVGQWDYDPSTRQFTAEMKVDDKPVTMVLEPSGESPEFELTNALPV